MSTAVLVEHSRVHGRSCNKAILDFEIPDLLVERHERIVVRPGEALEILPVGRIRNICGYLLPKEEKNSFIDLIAIVRHPDMSTASFHLELASAVPCAWVRGRIDSALRLCRMEPTFRF